MIPAGEWTPRRSALWLLAFVVASWALVAGVVALAMWVVP